MKPIETKEQLTKWADYREYLKQELKKLDKDAPVFVSKDKLAFDLEGKPWNGHAAITGPKAILSVNKLKKQGVMFREGAVRREGKDLLVSGLTPKLVKEAEKTFLKLRLGFKIVAGEEEAPGAPAEAAAEDAGSGAGGGAAAADPKLEATWKKLEEGLSKRIPAALESGADKQRITELVRRATEQKQAGDLAGAIATFKSLAPLLDGAGADLAARAGKIDKAVQIWTKTEEAATKELRKLQKAILDLDHPAGKPVIQGLEGILKRLDKVDDEAHAASEAAKKGDASAFEKARGDFLKKMNGILAYVEKDPLIADADSNPSVQIKIRETLTKSLNQLMKAV